MRHPLRGALTALITPFLPTHEIDWEGFIQNLNIQLESRIAGLVLLGTTGETISLTDKEQEALIKEAVKVVKGKIPLLIGTGTASTKTTLEKTHKAKELGADGALVVTPYYVKPTQEGLFLHYQKIARETAFPIYLYNVPGRTAVNLEPSTVSRLLEEPYIAGLKEASGSLPQLIEIASVTKTRKDFSLLSGDDALTVSFISHGAIGVISVLSNLLPNEMASLTKAALSGQIDEANKLSLELQPLMKACFIESNPIPIKAMMALQGMAAGPPRLPLSPLQEKNRITLEKAMLQYHPKSSRVSLLKILDSQ